MRLVSCLEKVAKTVAERVMTGDLSCWLVFQRLWLRGMLQMQC